MLTDEFAMVFDAQNAGAIQQVVPFPHIARKGI